MSRLDLSFLHRDIAHDPIVVKDADEIRGAMAFWKGLLIAMPVSVAIWIGLALLFGAC